MRYCILNECCKITQLSLWCPLSHKDITWPHSAQKNTDTQRWEMMSNSVFINTGCFPSVARPAGTFRRSDINTHTHARTHFCIIFVCEAWLYVYGAFLSLYSWILHMLLYTATPHLQVFTYFKCLWQCLSVCLPKLRQEYWRESRLQYRICSLSFIYIKALSQQPVRLLQCDFLSFISILL